MANSKVVSQKYIDLISQSAKDDEKEELGFRAEEASLEVKQAILETTKAVSVAKRALTKAKKAVPYSLQGEVEATNDLAELESGLAIAKTIEAERF